MQATALVWTDSAPDATTNRADINRANSQHSTGSPTAAGKQRSSLSAIRHGLTARTAVLASEDLATYQRDCRQFIDEYQPATATETQLVREWRELRDAAAILELHKDQGIPWEPADHGFVFSKDQVERCSQRMMRQNEDRFGAAACF